MIRIFLVFPATPHPFFPYGALVAQPVGNAQCGLGIGIITQTGIACGDTEAALRGHLLDGAPFEGTDSIVTVGCEAAPRQRLWLNERERLIRTDGRVIEPKLEDSNHQE